MNARCTPSRGRTWIRALVGDADAATGHPRSVLAIDARLGHELARFIAVVPDPDGRFPRARHGEVGLQEGWALARAVRDVIRQDEDAPCKRPIVAVVDVPSQAYGRREEAFGLHQALAAAVAAYAEARLAGHPVIGLIVGKAMSGAFLAHGYQANRLLALEDGDVMVHAMGKEAAARITLRSVEQLEELARQVPPMAYDIDSFATLGLLWRLLPVSDADTPTAADAGQVRRALQDAVADIRHEACIDLSGRLDRPMRHLSRTVRQHLKAQWS